jgi:nucleotide-binding universal stress UspA family protein
LDSQSGFINRKNRKLISWGINATLNCPDSTTRKIQQEQNVQSLFRKILVALDLSDQSPRVIGVASSIAKAFNAEVIVSTVANVKTSVAGNESDGFPANDQENNIVDSLRKLVEKTFEGETTKVDIKILHGNPPERISEYAEFSDCNLIIVGSRGQGALRKAILGSVSSSVVAKSKKSVLIVK